MDAASIATSSMKTLNFLSPSTTQRTTNPTTLTSSRPSNEATKSNVLTFYSNPRSYSFSLARCSTKPNTNTEDQNSTFDIDSNPEAPKEAKPNSSDELSSPLPSSSSSSGGLVFDLGTGNSWDSEDIGSPVVKRFLSDEEERWYMWEVKVKPRFGFDWFSSFEQWSPLGARCGTGPDQSGCGNSNEL
ncbi:hypothetical protein TorRG33x02_006990 [Trema orientale]|uniref:Uncharacterized protein n=1 Tax=Trema orientale TaxID=63057 RepID=A0A2P5G0C7_TREOI|nr:hypothetical protein TorRG33x02_006990 [Trema orientale]